MNKTSTEARARAEAAFKKKERQAIEGRAAMAEYEAGKLAELRKTARLRKQRLAREAKLASAPANTASAEGMKRSA